ncbi:MAG: hypothetical protein M1839_007851 [Geoglossum umbratile]|nr:MAG: hypothetical protein M1839_007851 [Geoglossum umbratile]
MADIPPEGSQKALEASTNESNREQNKREITEYFKKLQARLKIVKTTTSPNGQIIDWIPVESQGEIALPPPDPRPPKGSDKSIGFPETPVIADLEREGAERGPRGTVPIPRKDLSKIDFNRSLKDLLTKEPPKASLEAGKEQPTPTPGDHMYGSAYQHVTCDGGQGQFSCYNPTVEADGSESLIQLGILNEQLGFMQAIEAGWQVLPDLYGDHVPHLFTYFRTHYKDVGPKVGGYNDDTGDWVQYDGAIHPESTFSPLSTVGGPQYRLWIATQLYQDNWWIWAIDRWIGYYPAGLFRDAGGAAGAANKNTLAHFADRIGFWGEVADPASITTPTTTDMGSGEFPEREWPFSAYIHNLAYSPDTTGLNSFHFNGSGGVGATNTSWYRIVPHFTPDTTWGSFVWLGGAGSG